jgi:tetratricopeptide (TPR) repeat protein
MNKHVFISYKHDDNDFAENVIHRIKAEGFITWIDSDNLHPGEDWREGIDQAIQQAFALIVIMSPAAKASEYITYEWAYAWGRGIRVIPLMYKHTDLHPRLKSLQYLDFTNCYTSHRPWHKLIDVLKRVASTSQATPTDSSLSSVPQLTNEPKVQEWIDKGKLFLKRKDYEEALEAFRQTILLDPNNAYAYAGKSEALEWLEKYKEALIASEQAIKLDINLAYAWECKGSAYFGLKQYKEALSAFDEVLRLDPKIAIAWNNKGYILHQLKRYQDALNAYNEALRRDQNDATFWENKSDTLKELGRSEEAEECHKRAIELGYTEEV